MTRLHNAQLHRNTDGYLAGTLRDAQDIRSLLVQHFWFPEGARSLEQVHAADLRRITWFRCHAGVNRIVLLANCFFCCSTVADCIMELNDGQTDRFRLPTRHNILKGFEWLLHDVQPGDSLFFYFSGGLCGLQCQMLKQGALKGGTSSCIGVHADPVVCLTAAASVLTQATEERSRT